MTLQSKLHSAVMQPAFLVQKFCGHTHHVNTPDIPNANLTQLSDGSLVVVSTDRHGGFGVDVVCFANNSDGNTQKSFLVRFLKGFLGLYIT